MDIEDFVNKKLTKTGEMPNGDNIYLITEKSVNDIKKQLGVSGVGNHRELLAFLDWIGKNTASYSVQKPRQIVQSYLKDNCG